MAQVRKLDDPNETREVPNGVVQIVTLGDTVVSRITFQPGWKWSSDVKPIAGTEKCMFLHEGYCLSGSGVIQDADGTETTISAGDGLRVEPGHDAWVVGDEPWVMVETVRGADDYAKPN